MRVYVTFAMYGCPTIAPDLGVVLGVQPDKMIRKGTQLGGGRVAPQDGWFWSTKDKVLSDDVDVHLQCVFDVFVPLRDTLLQLILGGLRGEVILFKDTDSVNGSVFFSSDAIQKLAELSVSMYVDVWLAGE